MAFGFVDPAVMAPPPDRSAHGNDTCSVTQGDPSRVLLVELPGYIFFITLCTSLDLSLKL